MTDRTNGRTDRHISSDALYKSKIRRDINSRTIQNRVAIKLLNTQKQHYNLQKNQTDKIIFLKAVEYVYIVRPSCITVVNNFTLLRTIV